MKDIILLAETGSDITATQAEEMGVELVPMHVSFDHETKDDGAFPVEEIAQFYERTGRLPKTSGSSPEDFAQTFDRIHAEHPDAHILHLAYSAVTTCSYQSALIAAEGRDYVTSIDTKHVSAGQLACVELVCAELKAQAEHSIEKLTAFAKTLPERVRMCFIPGDLDYLRAGGRVSNLAAWTGKLLQLHPLIEILDGKLTATKKYRGNMAKLAARIVEEYTTENDLSKEHLWLLHALGTAKEICQAAEEKARALGFRNISWVKTGCVITTHGGPGAFGVVGTRN